MQTIKSETPQGIHALFAVGPMTKKIASKYAHIFYKPTLPFEQPKPPVERSHEAQKTLENEIDESFKEVAHAFENMAWTDAEAAKALEFFFKFYMKKMHEVEPLNIPEVASLVDFSLLIQWIHMHKNNSDAVMECLQITPPDNMIIQKLLSKKGNQKNVFLAMWPITQKLVVLKKLRSKNSGKAFQHESQSHPLSIKHPNIIETFYSKNSKDELFLLEEYLPEVLDDDWKSNGIYEAANLLYNIGSALNALHNAGRVHGDVKPDNIGKKGETYILLDFGTCNTIEEYKKSAPIGSLKTRAPEILNSSEYGDDPTKADVWALGATIFNTLVGRFPLLKHEEKKLKTIQRSNQKSELDKVLNDRIKKDWNEWVDLTVIPKPLDEILKFALHKNPKERGTMKQIMEMCYSRLTALLRTNSSSQPIFSLMQELEQLSTYFPEKGILDLMSTTERNKLKEKLEDLMKASGFNDSNRSTIATLLKNF